MHRIRSAITLLLPSILVSTSVLAADDAALQSVRAKIDTMFEEIAPENVTRSPVDGWFTVQKGSIIAYVSEDGRYLLQGDLIDLDLQTNLSERSRTEARKKIIAAISDDQVIVFSPAEVKHSVTVFTDVDCTYCRKLHSEIDEYMAEGIEIRYVLYPRNGPASPSWNTAEDVWCSNDRNRALTSAKQGRDFATNRCDSTAITRQYMMGQDVGLTGTPAIVFDDGTLVSGYVQAKKLAGRLLLIEQNAAVN